MPILFIDCEYFTHIEKTDDYECGIKIGLVLTVDEYGKVPIFCPDCPIRRKTCSQSISVEFGSVIRVGGIGNGKIVPKITV